MYMLIPNLTYVHILLAIQSTAHKYLHILIAIAMAVALKYVHILIIANQFHNNGNYQIRNLHLITTLTYSFPQWPKFQF